MTFTAVAQSGLTLATRTLCRLAIEPRVLSDLSYPQSVRDRWPSAAYPAANSPRCSGCPCSHARRSASPSH